MLALKKAFSDDKVVEFNNSTELKKFLIYQNPTALSIYKEQLKILQPNIKVVGIGTGLRLEKNDNK